MEVLKTLTKVREKASLAPCGAEFSYSALQGAKLVFFRTLVKGIWLIRVLSQCFSNNETEPHFTLCFYESCIILYILEVAL